MASEIGFALAGLIVLLWGVYGVLQKRIVHRLGEYMCMFLSHAAATLLLVVTGLFMVTWKLPQNFTSAVILVMALLAVTGFYLMHRAINLGGISVVAVCLASGVLFSTVLSWVLFDVKPELLNFIAIPILVIGVLFSMVRVFKLPKRLEWGAVEAFFKGESVEKASMVAIVAGALFGFYRLAFFFTAKDIGTHRTIIYSAIVMFIFLLFPFLGKSVKQLFNRPKDDDWRWLGISVGSYGVAAVTFFFALTKLKIDEALGIVIFFPAIAILLAITLQKERYKLWQYLGFLLAVMGYVMILL
ncbi:TPA: DMT family transporter [Candidatus Woesearchaeota archaeon]|nr:DMT family transporter [Candidatus Woesearchaeota archaeon]